MAKKEEAREVLKGWAHKFQPRKRFRTAYLGDGRGTERINLFVDENSPNPEERQLLWARYRLDGGDRFSIKNRTVNPVFNLPVFIGEKDEEPGVDQIVGVDYGSIPVGGNQYALPAHNFTHSLNGSDPIRLDSRQFMTGLVYPTSPPSLQLNLLGFVYNYSGWKVVDDASLPTLESLRPASSGSLAFVIIAIELATKTVEYFDSSYSLTGGQQTWDQFFEEQTPAQLQTVLPELPNGYTSLALVVLENTTTQISWLESINNLFDYRQFITGAAGGVVDGATQPGQLLFSVDGQSFSPRTPVTNSSGLIVTNSDGLIVVI